MKNFKNMAVYFFATIGFIVIACGGSELIDDIEDETTVVQSNNGKYQVASVSNSSGYYRIVVLNTDSGVMKTYSMSTYGDNWTNNKEDITFTH